MLPVATLMSGHRKPAHLRQLFEIFVVSVLFADALNQLPQIIQLLVMELGHEDITEFLRNYFFF